MSGPPIIYTPPPPPPPPPFDYDYRWKVLLDTLIAKGIFSEEDKAAVLAIPLQPESMMSELPDAT